MPYQNTLLYHGKDPEKPRFRLLGPTRISTVNIGGATIHSGFGIKPGTRLLDLNGKSKATFRNRLSHVKFLIIYEISLVSRDIHKSDNDDFIENIRDLFSILDHESLLIKTGFDNNYLEYMSNDNNSLSFSEYLELIKPYLYDLINVYKAKGEWKLQLSAEISFVLQKPGSNEMRTMYTRSTPEEIIIGSETEEVAENLIMSILQKYQDNLQNKMKGYDFIFNGVNYLYYDLNRIGISKRGSYIESPKWLKDRKCIINQKNTDNKCF